MKAISNFFWYLGNSIGTFFAFMAFAFGMLVLLFVTLCTEPRPSKQ